MRDSAGTLFYLGFLIGATIAITLIQHPPLAALTLVLSAALATSVLTRFAGVSVFSRLRYSRS